MLGFKPRCLCKLGKYLHYWYTLGPCFIGSSISLCIACWPGIHHVVWADLKLMFLPLKPLNCWLGYSLITSHLAWQQYFQLSHSSLLAELTSLQGVGHALWAPQEARKEAQGWKHTLSQPWFPQDVWTLLIGVTQHPSHWKFHHSIPARSEAVVVQEGTVGPHAASFLFFAGPSGLRLSTLTSDRRGPKGNSHTGFLIALGFCT